MKTTEHLVSQALASARTATSAQPTKETPESTAIWAKWLRLETCNDPQLTDLVNLCARFVRGIRDGHSPFWLSLLGKSGTGKTHCARRLWQLADRFAWTQCRYTPSFIYWPVFCDELREAVREARGMGRLLDMGRWPFLVLDDVGAERDPSGFAAEKLNLLLGMRVGKWTVLTSNLLLEGLSAVDDRIASRIVREPGNLFLELTTTDYGLRKQLNPAQ